MIKSHIKNLLRSYIEKLPILVNKYWLYWSPKNIESVPAAIMGKYEVEDTKFFALTIKPGWKVCDIGGYIGYYTTLFSELVGESGKVYCFEPNPESFYILTKNTKLHNLKNVEPYNLALGNRTGIVSMFSPNNSAPDTKVLFKGEETENIIRVPQRKLDFVISRDIKIDLIKMDVQGYELYILRGAEKTIRSNPNLILHIEFWPYGLRIANTKPEYLLNYITKDLGFNIFIMREDGLLEKVLENKSLITMAEDAPAGYLNLVCKQKNGISIIIPSYNCKKILFRLLSSLKRSDYKNFEVLVIDNGSNDNTLKDGRRKFPWIRFIDTGEKNIGQTGCYNLGFAHAKKGNHIMMVDSDVVVTPGMIEKLVERLELDSKIGIVTPLILYMNDHNWVNQAGANVNLFTGKVSIGWGPKKNFLKPKEVQNSGTVMIFKNELVNKIGCFEDWFLCYFDPDYCLRAKKAGYSTWYEPKAICYHDQSKDPNICEPRVLGRAYLLGRNRTLFMRKHGKFLPIYIAFLPVLFAYYFRTAIKYHIFSKWPELIRGTWDGFFYPIRKSLKVPFPKLW